MKTIFDLLTVGMFAGLIVLFLQRSVDQPEDQPYADHLWQYLVAGAGCATANWLGNEGYTLPAVAVIVAILAFIFYVLKPFGNRSGR